MKIIGVIPARMGSSRFPGKPLAPLLGKPMIEHVYKRAALSGALSKVLVATCDREIHDAVLGFGGQAVMTSNRHERASDRVAEAASNMDADVVVMIQGDEPLTHPDMIGEAVAPFLKDDEIQCVNLAGRIKDANEFNDPNVIKVVMDCASNALYFSRSPIPYVKDQGLATAALHKQICIIPFRHEALHRFASLLPTPLEIAESIDMLRFLEHGFPVRMVQTLHQTHAVDTPADLVKVEKMMADCPLNKSY